MAGLISAATKRLIALLASNTGAANIGTSGGVTVEAKLAAAATTYAALAGNSTQKFAVANGTGANDAVNVTQLASAVPSGAVFYFAASAAPTGYLKANGALVSRITYAALFAIIGTTFGAGDGATTFALPDLRGEFIRGFDDGRGVDAGRVFGSGQTDLTKAHTHGGVVGDSAIGNVPAGGSTVTPVGNQSIQTTGGSETRPRNVALLACIKY